MKDYPNISVPSLDEVKKKHEDVVSADNLSGLEFFILMHSPTSVIEEMEFHQDLEELINECVNLAIEQERKNDPRANAEV